MFKVFHFLTHVPYFLGILHLFRIYLYGFLIFCAYFVKDGGAPELFPIDADGFVHVSSLQLSIRFSFHDGSF